MTEVLALLRDRGYRADFSVPSPQTEPAIECKRCANHVAPSEVGVEGTWRFEGVSDPGDSAIVLALRCPHCTTRGVLVANYGPDMPTEVAEVVSHLA